MLIAKLIILENNYARTLDQFFYHLPQLKNPIVYSEPWNQN